MAKKQKKGVEGEALGQIDGEGEDGEEEEEVEEVIPQEPLD